MSQGSQETVYFLFRVPVFLYKAPIAVNDRVGGRPGYSSYLASPDSEHRESHRLGVVAHPCKASAQLRQAWTSQRGPLKKPGGYGRGQILPGFVASRIRCTELHHTAEGCTQLWVTARCVGHPALVSVCT